MASSPVVPGSAKQSRVKRRVVNLVNPADPLDFSEHSLSFGPSVGKENEPVVDRRERETTPSPIKPALPYTPLGIGKDGVRGILRQTGTPGSGNGVRFFPKNKFRIITPNQSLNPPSKVEEAPTLQPQSPASPRNNSFLSQLLAVTIPSMSPRRPIAKPVEPEPVPEPEEEQSTGADESWEVPGQEGEVSLIASSIASEPSMLSEEGQVEEWNGTPEVHSSPLGLTVGLPDISAEQSQDMDLPSREIQVPADMSDLLTQRLDRGSGVDSFSISDFSRTNLKSQMSFQGQISAIKEESLRNSIISGSKMSSQLGDMSGMRSFSSVGDRTDDNPTIRRPLSPPPARATPITSEPQTPPSTKVFSSIFADMSAEQAGLSWPLSAHGSPLKSEAGDITEFHSALYTEPTISTHVDLPASSVEIGSKPRSTPGDITQYFDCASPSPTTTVPALTLPGDKMLSNAPSPKFAVSSSLIHPAKALFEAHSAHTMALGSELELYRSLATKLQTEVSERDGLLAKLNLRVIEGEVWRVRVDELETQLRELKISQRAANTDRHSLSPNLSRRSPVPEHAGDRTTVDQAATRDAEIRLAKAVAEQESLSMQMAELQQRFNAQREEIASAHATIASMEEKNRDNGLQNRKNNEELRSQLELVTKRERALHAQLGEARQEMESGREAQRLSEALEQRVAEQETEIRQLQDLRMDDERELGELAQQVDELSARVAGEDELITKLAEAETKAGEERYIRKQVEKELKIVKNELTQSDREIDELKHSLEETKADLLARLDAPSAAPDGEISRLRAQSASKDLEIVTLQKRKNELKDDLEMLNIALDSKQQELELMKRKFAVRGVAGSTPLASSRKMNTATPTPGYEIDTPAPGRNTLNSRRRSSAAFVTPSIGSIRGHGKMLTGGHGTEAWKNDTAKKVLGKMDEENQAPVLATPRVGSLRRERLLA